MPSYLPCPRKRKRSRKRLAENLPEALINVRWNDEHEMLNVRLFMN
jgi:hypothetical protein